MKPLEVCRLSAEALGYKASHWAEPGDGIYLDGDITREWNPLTNAEQRWECTLKLMSLGWDVCFARENDIHSAANGLECMDIKCDASAFPAMALAELWKRDHDENARHERNQNLSHLAKHD